MKHRIPLPLALTVLTSLTLSGCSQLNVEGDYTSLVNMTRGLFNAANAQPPLATVLSIPYATLGYRIGKSPERMMVLTGVSTNPGLWSNEHGQAMVIFNGHITRTAGFAENISGLRLVKSTPDNNGRLEQRWMVNLDSVPSGPIEISCQRKTIGTDPITILGAKITTRHEIESCHSTTPSVKWHFQNHFWISEKTGTVWKVIQNIAPKTPPITYELFRKPV